MQTVWVVQQRGRYASEQVESLHTTEVGANREVMRLSSELALSLKVPFDSVDGVFFVDEWEVMGDEDGYTTP